MHNAYYYYYHALRSMELYSINLVIQGYHVYKDIWLAPIGVVLCYERESNPYAVVMFRDDVMIGHVPRVISAVCSVFIRRSVIKRYCY